MIQISKYPCKCFLRKRQGKACQKFAGFASFLIMSFISFFCIDLCLRTFGLTTSLNAEEAWKPADGQEWVETNFEADFAKLQKEAEARLDKVIEKLEAGVAESGVTLESKKRIEALTQPEELDEDLNFLKGFDFEAYKKDGKDYIRKFCVELDEKRTPEEVESMKAMDKKRKGF